ncbi:hypothetical protein B9Z55_027961 [Caenorhabditis nigoni]|uniref:Uncharacterized protein n=3 Tax=Caenorhabditis nigoni TaxID=1611254 RepID=A0A2G5SDB9_9PELO|nr:hypothetical protein B9Z55_027961 [Caenorhabditis nigoni]
MPWDNMENMLKSFFEGIKKSKKTVAGPKDQNALNLDVFLINFEEFLLALNSRFVRLVDQIRQEVKSAAGCRINVCDLLSKTQQGKAPRNQSENRRGSEEKSIGVKIQRLSAPVEVPERNDVCYWEVVELSDLNVF